MKALTEYIQNKIMSICHSEPDVDLLLERMELVDYRFFSKSRKTYYGKISEMRIVSPDTTNHNHIEDYVFRKPYKEMSKCEKKTYSKTIKDFVKQHKLSFYLKNKKEEMLLKECISKLNRIKFPIIFDRKVQMISEHNNIFIAEQTCVNNITFKGYDDLINESASTILFCVKISDNKI